MRGIADWLFDDAPAWVYYGALIVFLVAMFFGTLKLTDHIGAKRCAEYSTIMNAPTMYKAKKCWVQMERGWVPLESMRFDR